MSPILNTNELLLEIELEIWPDIILNAEIQSFVIQSFDEFECNHKN